MTAAQAGYDERGMKTGDALAKFPANEADSSAKLAASGGQNEMSQMLQQIPQMASGLAGSLSGALGGLLQPLGQMTQQVAQIGQQAMQAGMSGLQHGTGAAATGEAIPGELLGAKGGAGELGGGGGGGVGGGLGTTPTAMLGPLPAPSAGTEPASAHSATPPPANASAQPAVQRGAMGAMPMMPPGAMHGAGGTGSDAKADTKRVVAPSVKNGAPVQGRITTPPPTPEVTKRGEGKPIASRRILLPDHKREDDGESGR
ncbi:hypothetical protein ACQI5H_08150 [Mycobacterium heidelbergense]|uniref:hypothetical protein n=1 Tax=Mycobacterium heidelbergense TaxID=53376 RepID=UPI003CF55A3D